MTNIIVRSIYLCATFIPILQASPVLGSDLNDPLYNNLVNAYRSNPDENGKRKRKEVTLTDQDIAKKLNTDDNPSPDNIATLNEPTCPEPFSDNDEAEEDQDTFVGHKREAGRALVCRTATKLQTTTSGRSPIYVQAGVLYSRKHDKLMFEALILNHLNNNPNKEKILEYIQNQYDDGYVRSPEEYSDLLVALSTIQPDELRDIYKALRRIIEARIDYVPCSYHIFIKSFCNVPTELLDHISQIMTEFILISDYPHLHLHFDSIVRGLCMQQPEWLKILPAHIRYIKNQSVFKNLLEDLLKNKNLPRYVWLQTVVQGKFLEEDLDMQEDNGQENLDNYTKADDLTAALDKINISN